MGVLVIAVQVELWLFLGVLAAIVGYGTLTGSIRTKNLFFDKSSGTVTISRDKPPGAFSVARVQLLFLTFLYAAYYVMQLSATPGQLPDIPQPALAVLLGSHAVYLGDKSVKSLRGN